MPLVFNFIGLESIRFNNPKGKWIKTSILYINLQRIIKSVSHFIIDQFVDIVPNRTQHFWCLNLVIFGNRRVMSKYRFGLRIIIVLMNSCEKKEYQFYGDGQRDKKVKKRRFTMNSFYEISLYQNDYLFTVTSQFCPLWALISNEKKNA